MEATKTPTGQEVNPADAGIVDQHELKPHVNEFHKIHARLLTGNAANLACMACSPHISELVRSDLCRAAAVTLLCKAIWLSMPDIADMDSTAECRDFIIINAHKDLRPIKRILEEGCFRKESIQALVNELAEAVTKYADEVIFEIQKEESKEGNSET